MDYRKINSHVILLLIVIIVGLAIAMLGRLIALNKGVDGGTANLVFVLILGMCVLAYLIIIATIAQIIVPWAMKKKNPIQIAVQKDNTPDEATPGEAEQVEEKESPGHLIDVDAIRQNSEKSYNEKLAKQIVSFIEYSHLTMAPYITDDELLLLDSYIECYARSTSLPDNFVPIKPKRLKNTDIFHFGWNMAHFFDIGKKYEVVPWLQNVFADLKELEYSSIKGKLYTSATKNDLIPNNDEIPRFLAQKKG